LSISLFFPGLAAEKKFENLIDDSLPATRHRSKNITDSKNKISDADEEAFAADSDYFYDNKVPVFTFTAENEFFNDCNYELILEEIAVDPLLRLTRSVAATYFSPKRFPSTNYRKSVRSEKPVV
jgi:hypothetical protein